MLPHLPKWAVLTNREPPRPTSRSVLCTTSRLPDCLGCQWPASITVSGDNSNKDLAKSDEVDQTLDIQKDYNQLSTSKFVMTLKEAAKKQHLLFNRKIFYLMNH